MSFNVSFIISCASGVQITLLTISELPESWASSNDGTFMEVSAPSQAFDNPSLGLGLYGEWHNNFFTVAGNAPEKASQLRSCPFRRDLSG